MTGEDVELCAEVGADAVIVSNHGGRHLDNTLATIEVLGEAVAAAKGKLDVYVDGGIRRGADVVKAIALGAKAVFVGRPLFWGLAVDGEKGVVRMLDILREEIEITMAKCGRPTDFQVSIPRRWWSRRRRCKHSRGAREFQVIGSGLGFDSWMQSLTRSLTTPLLRGSII